MAINVAIHIHVLYFTVYLEFCRGTRLSCSSLVHENDAVDTWIEEPAIVGHAATTRTAVTEGGMVPRLVSITISVDLHVEDRITILLSALLVVHLVEAGYTQPTTVVRL